MKTLDLLKILVPSVGGIAAFAYYLSHLVDHGASNLAKQEIARVAKKRVLLPASRSAFNFFVLASDKFFGKKLFSWKAFLRSVVLSALWIFLILAICFFTIPNYKIWLGSELSRKLILNSAVPLVSASLVLDFFSLCLTRYIVKSSLGKRNTHIYISILIDLFLSVLLFYIGFSLVKAAFSPGHMIMGPLDALHIWLSPSVLPTEIMTLQPLTTDMLVPDGKGAFTIKGGLLTEIVYGFPEAILFLSSLFTSIWLWLYVLGYVLLYSAVRIDKVSVWLTKRLDFDHSPATAVAIAIVAACMLLSIVIVICNFIYQLVAH